ncbi:MAG: hypothetical protein LUQ47_01840 [Methanotrichaceae archaeon]|nr:hypothetical protein [Methanotrichaceae archaeon]
MKIGLILALLLLPIANAVSDTTPPKLVSFDFEPKVVNVSKSDQDIKFTMQVKDDLSGMSGWQGIFLDSPSKGQNKVVNFNGTDDLVAGDMMKGTYVANMTISQYGESGRWHISAFLLADNFDNKLSLNETQLKNLGFPTEIEVKS